MTTVTITIDGREVKTEAGNTVMQAALAAGIDIPKLCHHPAVESIGACRICLVEIEKQRVLQPACTFPVSEGMVIKTDSPAVAESRKFVLNLLFSERNHFCMFCQMSGNCELQDLAYRYKMDHWLYDRAFPKLSVDSSRTYFVMDHNRCILCRRCIRACGDLVGNHTLGLRQRGADSMMTADMDVPFGESSCVSCGTCLQVCPVGALLDRTSAYGGVEEKVERVKTTCQSCSNGCSAELIVRDNHVLRVESDWNGEVNHGLLCVMGRFEPLYDSRERVTKPMVRKGGELVEATWNEALETVARHVKGLNGSIGAVVSSRVTNETAALFAKMFGTGSKVGALTPLPEALTQAEGDLAALDSADLYILVGSNLLKEQPVAAFAIMRGVTNRGARLMIVGEGENALANIAYRELKPADAAQAAAIAQGASRPVVVYGAKAGAELAVLRAALKDKAQFVGMAPGVNSRGLAAAGLAKAANLAGAKALYILAADDVAEGGLAQAAAMADFVVFQGSYHGAAMTQADVVLPSPIWAERAGTLTSTEGRTQPVVAGIKPPVGVKADVEILTDLAAKMGLKV
jgi:formate dehydrogenase major subunit